MQIGRFKLEDKGTLVLDEITELPLDLQMTYFCGLFREAI
jgi:transcriptional regulator with GAF, ATPase, and Fis domain